MRAVRLLARLGASIPSLVGNPISSDFHPRFMKPSPGTTTSGMPCGSAGSQVSNKLSWYRGRQAFRHWRVSAHPRSICPDGLGVPENTLASAAPVSSTGCRLEVAPSSSVEFGHRQPTMPSPHPHVQLWLPCDVPEGADPPGGPLFFIRTVFRYHAHLDEAIHASKPRGTALFKLMCPPLSLLWSIYLAGAWSIWSLAHLEPIAYCTSQKPR